jgi:cyclophilin family peptidyl-prolyl cis-trans isomerase
MYKWVLLITVGFMSACSNADPETTRLLTEEYPPLYEAVFERDGEELLQFTNHEDKRVAAQAWNALISTEVENVDYLLERVVEANTKEAWASLWFKELSENHIERLKSLWVDKDSLRLGIATVFGYQGDEQSLNLLLGDDKLSHELEIALAVGQMSGRIELSTELELKIVERAFESPNAQIGNAYLYGFYRTLKDLKPETIDRLHEGWDNYIQEEEESIEQYLVRILMKDDVDRTIYHFDSNDYEWMDTQLAIEIVRGLGRYDATRQTPVVLNALLDNRNVNVRIETLKAIKAKHDELGDQLDRTVLNKIGLIRGYEAPLRLQALDAVTSPAKYIDDVNELAASNPYLLPLKYSIYSKVYDENKMLEVLSEDLNNDDRLFRFYTLQELGNWWGNLGDELKIDMSSQVRPLIIEEMKVADRSMVYILSGSISDSLLILDSDYPKIEAMLSRFKLPEDVEVFQAMGSVLKERFDDEAESYIQKLAAEGNVALNQTLASQGWNIEAPDGSETEFREPDWKRLSKLGPDPILKIETNKGEIVLRLDVLTAPATISGMDALIKERRYHRIPFHRVIPNFVIQGGDVESQDGFGGPNYVVPTEASTKQYYRGRMGIASAGTDTEGSQYFIMHQWMPHLNGLYTIVGEVVEGMEVVDRIVMGDYVKRMNWN